MPVRRPKSLVQDLLYMARYNLSEENPSPNEKGRVFVRPCAGTTGASNWLLCTF